MWLGKLSYSRLDLFGDNSAILVSCGFVPICSSRNGEIFLNIDAVSEI